MPELETWIMSDLHIQIQGHVLVKKENTEIHNPSDVLDCIK